MNCMTTRKIELAGQNLILGKAAHSSKSISLASLVLWQVSFPLTSNDYTIILACKCYLVSED